MLRPSVWFTRSSLLLLCLLAGCQVTDLRLWTLKEPASNRAWEVERVRGLDYSEGRGKSSRHRLDLFLPRGHQDVPVVVLIHGGAWIVGDNRCCGLYSSVGEFLASQGIAAVLPNYRLTPSVKHPEHIKDVARAVAWVHRHIAEFGGRPDQIFLVGHSAGGHLATLLATDEKYLKAEGFRPQDIRGVVGISGVYEIPPGKIAVSLGGSNPSAFHLNSVMPVRGNRGSLGLGSERGIPLRLNVYGPVFGNDPKVRADASPIHHVRPGLPPMLLLSAEHDLPTLPGMAADFHRALTEKGCEAQLQTVENRNHNSILFRAVERDDPVARALLEFVGRQTQRGAAAPSAP